MKKIPDFRSLEEASDYWDTHSFADKFEDTEPIKIEVCLPKRRIMLEINPELGMKLNNIARKKKQSCEKLINSWIKEKIIQEAAN